MMKAKKTYTIPETDVMTVDSHGSVMQDLFSGGDPKGTGIIIGKESDESDDDNRSNQWSNHLWDDI